MTKEEILEANELFHTGFESFGNPMRSYIHDRLMTDKHYKSGYKMASKKSGDYKSCWKKYKKSINI